MESRTSFNSRSPSGLRQRACKVVFVPTGVSIHAAQAGCDLCPLLPRGEWAGFNSRSPSGLRPASKHLRTSQTCFNSRSPSGLRRNPTEMAKIAGLFQFTQPKRAATCRPRWVLCLLGSFNSRSPSGLRPQQHSHPSSASLFQFTQPKRAATEQVQSLPLHPRVSIHAAQAGCDV